MFFVVLWEVVSVPRRFCDQTSHSPGNRKKQAQKIFIWALLGLKWTLSERVSKVKNDTAVALWRIIFERDIVWLWNSCLHTPKTFKDEFDTHIMCSRWVERIVVKQQVCAPKYQFVSFCSTSVSLGLLIRRDLVFGRADFILDQVAFYASRTHDMYIGLILKGLARM